MPLSPPLAPEKPHVDHRHGVASADPFHWLKDPNWQAVLKNPSLLAPDIRAYLEAENAYSRAELADTAALQQQLVAELKGRLQENDFSVPLPDGPYAYYQRFEPNAQYPRYLRCSAAAAQATDATLQSQPRAAADEELLLDLAAQAIGQAFFRVLMVRHSPDHQRLAYSVDALGSERYEIRVHSVSPVQQSAVPGNAVTSSTPMDVISGAAGNFIWCGDSLSYCYIAVDDHLRPKEVRRHRLGQPQSEDELLYRESDDGFFLRLGLSSSRAYIVLTAHDHDSSEVHVLEAHDPAGRFRCIEPRRPGVIYNLSHHGADFYLTLHAGAAKDGRIVLAPVRTPSREHWREAVPFRPGHLLDTVLHLSEHMVRLETAEALPRLVITTLASGEEHSVSFTEEAYALALVPGYEFATTKLRFTYSSPRLPEQTWEYDAATRSRRLLKQQAVPSGHDPEHYELKRLTCLADDGAPIPVTLLRRRPASLAVSGHATATATTTPQGTEGPPLLLYGYGSYGISSPMGFSPHRLSLVDRGITYAIAHIRGGKDRGYAWYEGGKLLNKKRTFYDFIAVARWLSASGYVAPGKLLAQGGSAGGMLMGAVANMAPELFGGIIAEVPFVDVLNTMWDETLPLTPPEWLEWGNPILDKAAHAYIASYSPYDNVREQAYPPLLILAGLTDPRVTYWEPAKWVAKLRRAKTNAAPLLLQVNMDAGHAGASGRFDSLYKIALTYAFILKTLGHPDAGLGRAVKV